jgi:hypothetical protein
MKFYGKFSYRMYWRKLGFLENRLSESSTLLTAVNKFLPLLFILLDVLDQIKYVR